MKFITLSLIAALMAQLSPGNTPLDDPADEARALRLMREIRCVACENEPISQSAAPIADDMRAKVRDLISEGASDAEVREWFVSRYDDYVLFRPPSRGIGGLLLWGTPFILLLGIGGVLFVSRMGRGTSDIEAVAPESFDHENGKDQSSG
ncbi:MAG: cytochrome c-type biogenesis protein [Pseudomonadota bacterium]